VAAAAVAENNSRSSSRNNMSSSSSEEETEMASREDFGELLKEARKDLRLTDEQLAGLKVVKKIEKKFRGRNWFLFAVKFIAGSLVVGLLACVVAFALVKYKTKAGKKLVTLSAENVNTDECVIPSAELVQDYLRPAVDCNLCKDVEGLSVVNNISPEEFHKKFAFTMKPLLVKGGQKNWDAKEVFSMDYFRKIYPKDSEALDKVKRDCQFFPYQTKFEDLGEVFQMSKDRELGKEKPWYIGWSNCDGMTANELRKHYKKPTFLPEYYEHANTDWVFMGLPGYGANMHIDSIDIQSWQAQIKGTKKWILQTPPECYGICKYRMEIIVEPGDIVVLDTNRWYHSTEIVGNETSIVIGSEFF